MRELCFTSLFIVHHNGGRYGGSSGSVHGHVSLRLPHILGSRYEAEARNSGWKQGHTINKACLLCPLHPGSHFLPARPHLLKVLQLDDTAVPDGEQVFKKELVWASHTLTDPNLMKRLAAQMAVLFLWLNCLRYIFSYSQDILL